MKFAMFWKTVLIKGKMLLPVIVSSIKDIIWYSALTLLLILFPIPIDLFGKILISVIIVVVFNILYTLFVGFLLWKKYKQKNIPESILSEATFREKEKFVSEEIALLKN